MRSYLLPVFMTAALLFVVQVNFPVHFPKFLHVRTTCPGYLTGGLATANKKRSAGAPGAKTLSLLKANTYLAW
jgi:hypothetical protein